VVVMMVVMMEFLSSLYNLQQTLNELKRKRQKNAARVNLNRYDKNFFSYARVPFLFV
jgi:hypothetical protein